MIARAFPVELGIVAEIGNVIEQLSVLSERTRPNQRRVAARQAFIAAAKAALEYAVASGKADGQIMAEQGLPALPGGFTYPDICTARAQMRDRVFELPGFAVSPWRLAVPLIVQGETTGRIEVC